jgi:hypothetical protein
VRLAVLVVVAAGCGDNLPAPDVLGMPDLTLVASQMDGTIAITDDEFALGACEMVEGCINDIGLRRLLRFDTVTANIGTADLDLGQVPPAGVSDGIFVWSPCHMHHHVMGFASYSLSDAGGVVATGHKQGFCIEDDEQILQEGPSHGFNCNIQGITRGWADAYSKGLPCQWVDITDVLPGTYTLTVVIDASGILPDSNPDDNLWSTTVTL